MVRRLQASVNDADPRTQLDIGYGGFRLQHRDTIGDCMHFEWQ